MGKKNRKPSAFAERLRKQQLAAARAKMSPEQRQAQSMRNLESIFLDLGNKNNRYLFYCPDMPFASGLGKTVYEFAYKLKELGFNTCVLHEHHGFKPSWYKEEWVKDVKIDYVHDKPSKSGKQQAPSYKFRPTDTIILPEGFWSLAQGFKEIKPVTKVILALGYGGMITAEPGMDWSFFGFTDVICLSEQLKEDYKDVWPHFRYHVVNYSIDTEKFKPVKETEVLPHIALSARNREDAQSLINVFYNKYPYLDMFEFKVMKKLDTTKYAETLNKCAVQVFVDEKSGHPAPPLEGLASGVPTIAVYGRGMEHLAENENIMWSNTNDPFILAQMLAQFCLTWLQSPTTRNVDTEALAQYTADSVNQKLLTAFDAIQDHKIQSFTAIKKAVEDGQLDYSTAYDADEAAEPSEANVNKADDSNDDKQTLKAVK